MRKFMVILLSVSLSFSIISIANADGILRIPQGQQDDILYSLVGVHVSVEIHEQVAITTIRNSFQVTGEEEDSLDVSYHFPVPTAASVIGFGVWRGENYVEFELRPGEQGGPGGGVSDNPSLKEYLGSNPFSIPLTDIVPGIFMTQLSYAQLLPYSFGTVEMTYPLCCGNFIVEAIDTVDIQINLAAQRNIIDLESDSYPDNTEIEIEDEHNATVSLLMEDVRPANNLRMKITFDQEDIGAWIYTHRSDPEKPGYFIMVIEPGIVDTAEQVQKYFTFVFDRSGSMSGSKISQAKGAVNSCLNHLIEDDFFNIVDFASNIDHFQVEPVEANIENINLARQYVEGLSANGSTNIYGALLESVEQEMEEGSANQIVFTTDGRPTAGFVTDDEGIISGVTEANVFDARIFSFGIGNDLREGLLAGLSDANHGMHYLINPQEADIDAVISDFYETIARPAMVNPEVVFEDELEVDSIYPRELQDLTSGKQLYLYGLYNSFGVYDVTLEGSLVHGDTSFLFEDISFPEEDFENVFVPRMWAKSVIDYWLNWMLIHGERQDIVDMIEALSIEYGILTPYTEYDSPEPPPGNAVPAIFAINAGQTAEGVHLTWSFNAIATTLTFNVYRTEILNGNFTRINDQPLTMPLYLDREAENGARYFYRIEMIADGESYMSDVISVGQIPETVSLSDAYPNPFNSSTRFNYNLPEELDVIISVHDMTGRFLFRLFNGRQSAGSHLLTIDGSFLPAGSYILRLKAGDRIENRPLVLVK